MVELSLGCLPLFFMLLVETVINISGLQFYQLPGLHLLPMAIVSWNHLNLVEKVETVVEAPELHETLSRCRVRKKKIYVKVADFDVCEQSFFGGADQCEEYYSKRPVIFGAKQKNLFINAVYVLVLRGLVTRDTRTTIAINLKPLVVSFW